MLPKNLKYGQKVESAPSRSTRVNIAPQNGTNGYSATSGDTIIINIPTRNNLCLVSSESYLKFATTITSGADGNICRWDSMGAHGLIQRIRVFSGSNLLEDIDQYSVLASILFNHQVPTDSAYGKYNILAGTRNDLITTLPTFTGGVPASNAAYSAVNNDASINTAIAPIVTALSAISRSSLQVNSGESIGTLANAGTFTATYCLNLISLVGTLCSTNYFPLFACSSAPLRVEIVLQNNANACFSSSAAITSVILNNVEYVANFIELSDSAMSMVYGSLQGSPLQFVVPSYRNFQYSYQLANANTQVNFPISAKFSSLRAIYCTIRDKLTGAQQFFPCSSVTKNLTDYYFRLGSTIAPTKAPNTYQEMFCEVCKAIANGGMSDLNHQPSVEKASYTMTDSLANNAPGTVNSGSFLIGMDLESYANADKSSLFAGYNSNTDDIFCVMNFGANGTTPTVRFDAFALFDSVVVFENNTAYCKF